METVKTRRWEEAKSYNLVENEARTLTVTVD